MRADGAAPILVGSTRARERGILAEAMAEDTAALTALPPFVGNVGPGPEPAARILVIDDDELSLSMYAEILEEAGFHVNAVGSGASGISCARVAAPDLVLCDVSMPEVDGYGVLRALRREPATAVVPIVFLTGISDSESLRRGMEAGADDYLCKPVDCRSLVGAVRARLARHAAAAMSVEHQLEELRSSLAMSLPHELLTPLTAVMGLASMLRDDVSELDPEIVREAAAQICRGGEALQQSVGKFLLLAELEMASQDEAEGAKMRAQRARTSVIGEAARQTAARLGRGADLTVSIEPGRLAMERTHLAALVSELTENAAVFSHAGTPLTVRCSRSDLEHVSIEVEDRGHGMVEQAEGFATFRHLARRHVREPGINLGLAIVRRLATLYDGGVTFETRPGGGTMVRVRVPYETGRDAVGGAVRSS